MSVVLMHLVVYFFVTDRVSICYIPWTWSHCWFWTGAELWKVCVLSLPQLVQMGGDIHTWKFYLWLWLLWIFFRRYGLLGLNGCGKSTLLTAIGCRELPIPDHMDIYHLSREIEASDMSALEAVISCDEERLKLEKEAEALAAQVSSSNHTSSFYHFCLIILYGLLTLFE